MVYLGIIMFSDLIALLECVCFLLSLKQHHYGDPIDAYGTNRYKHMQHICTSVIYMHIYVYILAIF